MGKFIVFVLLSLVTYTIATPAKDSSMAESVINADQPNAEKPENPKITNV